MAFDLDTVRADFPILSEVIHGKRLVYLDSGASAQKPVQVLDRMDYAFRHEYANVHRGLHTLANRATDAYEGSRSWSTTPISCRGTFTANARVR